MSHADSPTPRRPDAAGASPAGSPAPSGATSPAGSTAPSGATSPAGSMAPSGATPSAGGTRARPGATPSAGDTLRGLWWWSPTLALVVGLVVVGYQLESLRGPDPLWISWAVAGVGAVVALAGAVRLIRAYRSR